MIAHATTLESLYRDFERSAEGSAPGSDSTAIHNAILARLQDNRSLAQTAGWTAIEFRRLGGTGRLYLEGAPPQGGERAALPDWAGAPNPDRYEVSADTGALVDR
jgi:hypothetical protein